jgi:hypothetical protein
MSDFHKGIENNNLAILVLMHICVLDFLRPNLNYTSIYSLCPTIYTKSTCSNVKIFLYYNIMKYFLFILNFYSRATSYRFFDLHLTEPYVMLLFNSLVVLSPLLIFIICSLQVVHKYFIVKLMHSIV